MSKSLSFTVASSSSDNKYNVEFTAENNIISARCYCEAGVHRMICKHKTTLINGDSSLLSSKDQIKLLEELQSWPEIPLLQKQIQNLNEELKKLDKKISEIKNKKSELKGDFYHELFDGIEVIDYNE